jgi:hypothetical protein
MKPGAFKLRVNWIQLVQPHLVCVELVEEVHEGLVGQGPSHGFREELPRCSGTSCEFEKANALKTGDHFIGRLKGQAQGLSPGAFKLWVKLDS